MGGPPRLSYVLPIKVGESEDLDELTAYLSWVSRLTELIVVDGSPSGAYARHEELWGGFSSHLAPDPDLRFLNGKVNGVITGIRRASHEAVVIADDDVRYDEAGLRSVTELLSETDLVRPQNYFDPLPWHARWDTARSLINRAGTGDYPGTLGVRRSTFLGMGGYDGDVLFENLELMRTVEAAGGRMVTPLDLFVLRRPPPARRFWSQRVRQAYDDFARPARLALFLSFVPGLLAAGSRRRWKWAAAGMAATFLVAETGRRRGNGAQVFPRSASLWAPVWALERSVCSWAALGTRLAHGGCPYGDAVIRRAATPMRTLRASARVRRSAGRPKPRGPVGTITKGLDPRMAASAERYRSATGLDLVAAVVE